MKRTLTGIGRVVGVLPLAWVAACGSITPLDTTDGGGQILGTGGGAGSGDAGGTGGGADGSAQKDGSPGDSTPLDATGCLPGERRCEGDTPMTCGANGVWQAGTTCSNVCAGGSCVGVCVPGMKMCVGNIPQYCDSQGLWQSAPACGYVCRQGDCTGVCQPGARQCSSSGAPQSCNGDGAWETGTACPFVCSQGVCSGSCRPGEASCNGNVPQTCTSTGDWQSGASCPFVCTNGQCAGSCTPNARQCASNVPQTCSGSGVWQNGSPCSFVCAGGACSGSCAPGGTRCSSGQRQICDATGNWQGTASPPVQLLANPAFDAGRTLWVESTALAASYIITPDSALSSLGAHTPSYVAWLGGYDNAQDDISQVVTVPTGATSMTLTFYYAIVTAEITTSANDTMDVYTYEPSGGTYTALATFNDNMPVSSWTRFTINLPSSLAGRTFQLGFRARNDANKNTNFFIDSVALDVVACTP